VEVSSFWRDAMYDVCSIHIMLVLLLLLVAGPCVGDEAGRGV
jgi:hypothetical protein